MGDFLFGVKNMKKQIIEEPFEEFNQPEFADFEEESAKNNMQKSDLQGFIKQVLQG